MTTLDMLKVLTDSLQSALIGVYFELPGSQDDKFVMTLVESSVIFFDNACEAFQESILQDPKYSVYLARFYMVKFLYSYLYYGEEKAKIVNLCESMFSWYNTAIESLPNSGRSALSNLYFEKAMALYLLGVVKGNEEKLSECVNIFDISQQLKPFKNISPGKTLVWRNCVKDISPFSIASEFLKEKHVVYNGEVFSSHLSGTLRFGNTSEKSWEGKAFFQNMKKVVDFLELDQNAQFVFVYTFSVSLVDDLMHKNMISKVNFVLQTGTGSRSISRSYPQEFKLTAVGTEAHPIRVEVWLNRPFEQEPFVIETVLHLEGTGQFEEHTVFLA
jgi:hypothetical protein